jgi:energy-coupling factor transport system ATP-binding protein
LSDLIVWTRDLGHIYQPGPLQKVALEGISIGIPRGSCVAIVGATGSGKSTLVQHIDGLLRPTSGSIFVDGFEVGPLTLDVRPIRRHVGILFQSSESQLFGRTIFEDVAFGPRRQRLPKAEVRARVDRALSTVGLPPREFAARSPFELSGGQMRRVALAGVLAMSPSILVLDEPTVGLDAVGRAEFYDYLRRARAELGLTIILVSHDMSEVADLAEWLFVLHEGRLVAHGAPSTIFALGDCLSEWGLLPPPLAQLLGLLCQRGIPVPSEGLSLDEATQFLLAHPHLSSAS